MSKHNSHSHRRTLAALGVGLAAVCGVDAARATEPAPARTALLPAPRATQPPEVLTLEWPLGTDGLEVAVRSPGPQRVPRVLGRVPLVDGGAFRGAARTATDGSLEVFVVAQQAHGRAAASYESALFRVRAGAPAERLAERVANGSTPLVTARGTVLVARGSDGPALEITDHTLRHRSDALSIEALDGAGARRPVWRDEGQLAFLATVLGGDEALLYHVTERGAFLLVLDAARGTSRRVAGPMPALARDFSYDATRGEVLFARADEHDPARRSYELVALPLDGRPPRTVLRAASDRLMPRALCGRALAFSAAQGGGLALVPSGAAGSAPVRLAPFGEGTDAVVAADEGCRWLALRHTTLGPAVLQRHFVYAPGTGARFELAEEHDRALRIVTLLAPRASHNAGGAQ